MTSSPGEPVFTRLRPILETDASRFIDGIQGGAMEGFVEASNRVSHHELEAVLTRFQAWSTQQSQMDKASSAKDALAPIAMPQRSRIAQRLVDEMALTESSPAAAEVVSVKETGGGEEPSTPQPLETAKIAGKESGKPGLRSASHAGFGLPRVLTQKTPRAMPFGEVLAKTVDRVDGAPMPADFNAGDGVEPDLPVAMEPIAESRALTLEQAAVKPEEERPVRRQRTAGSAEAGALAPAKKKNPVRRAGKRGAKALTPARSAELLELSEGEEAELRRRAMEAGLPVNAYIRQCVLEVEVLRGIVDRTIAAGAAGAAGRSSAALAVSGGLETSRAGGIGRAAIYALRNLTMRMRGLFGWGERELAGGGVMAPKRVGFGTTLGLNAERRGLPQVAARGRRSSPNRWTEI